MSPELQYLVDEARKVVSAMSPAQYRAMLDRQRESWVRAFSTPCEHGELDFEQCGQCMQPTTTQGTSHD